METTLRLPVGVESFETIRRENYFYIDKTALIEQLLESGGMVSLFTRPRRFGKTLNMSMLRCFFEIGRDPALFEGLAIAGNQSLCDAYLGKFPVIFLTLKDVDGLSFEAAKYQLVELISKESRRHEELKDSTELDETDKAAFASLTDFSGGKYRMDDDTLYGSLQTLSALLHKLTTSPTWKRPVNALCSRSTIAIMTSTSAVKAGKRSGLTASPFTRSAAGL